MRRMPQQQRGQRRVDQIMDSAARTFAEFGIESATTNAIAERAKTSIGSLYQFFPNKEAIILALVERYLMELPARLDIPLAADCATNIDLFVEALYQYGVEQPGFVPLFYGSYQATSAPLVPVENLLSEQITSRISGIIVFERPGLSETDLRLQSRLVVRSLAASLHMMHTQEAHHHSSLLRELKRLLTNYVCNR